MKRLIALGALLLCSSLLHAQSVIPKVWDRAAFWVQPNTVSATCIGFVCSASANIFANTGALGFSCLQPVGTKCIYQIDVKASAKADISIAYFNVVVDGVNQIRVDIDDPQSNITDFRLIAFSHITTVSNTVTNQLHTIEIDIACDSIFSDSCLAAAGPAIARIYVFH